MEIGGHHNTHVISSQRKGLWYPFNRRLDWTQSWCGCLEV